MGRDSSVGIATRYGLDGPGIVSQLGSYSAPVQTCPEAYPVSCTMGTGSFPGVKRPGRGADHPPPSKRRDHERVGRYLYSPSRPQRRLGIGKTFTFTEQIAKEVSNFRVPPPPAALQFVCSFLLDLTMRWWVSDNRRFGTTTSRNVGGKLQIGTVSPKKKKGSP